MVNYQKGKIYTIRSRNSDKVYVGSTCNELRKRFHGHKKKYKRWIDGKGDYVSSYEVFKDGNCYIELLEKCPCNDKNELERREGQLIRSMECVNKIKYPTNPRPKGYTINDTFYEYPNIPAPPTPNCNPNFIRIKCDCGHIIRSCMLPRHKKSGTHIYLMNEREKNNQDVS
jgi:hypothetical protein